MQSTIDDEKLKEKISDKEAITSKCEEIIKWLDANQLAKAGEFEDKQKEMEAICNPIVTKLNQDAGGEGTGVAFSLNPARAKPFVPSAPVVGAGFFQYLPQKIAVQCSGNQMQT